MPDFIRTLGSWTHRRGAQIIGQLALTAAVLLAVVCVMTAALIGSAVQAASDARALPVLQKYSTGAACDHHHRLCQHELRKAIRLCNGATNQTSHLWR